MSRVRWPPPECLTTLLTLECPRAVLSNHVFLQTALGIEQFLAVLAANLVTAPPRHLARAVPLMRHVRALVAVRLAALARKRRQLRMLAHVTFIADLLEESLAADLARELVLAATALEVQHEARVAAELLVAAVAAQRRAVNKLVVLQQHSLTAVQHVADITLELLACMSALMTR